MEFINQTFVHFDYGMNVDIWRSTIGIVHKLESTTIDLSSKLQSTMTMWTIAVEYTTFFQVAKDIVFLCRLLVKLGLGKKRAILLLSDN